VGDAQRPIGSVPRRNKEISGRCLCSGWGADLCVLLGLPAAATSGRREGPAIAQPQRSWPAATWSSRKTSNAIDIAGPGVPCAACEGAGPNQSPFGGKFSLITLSRLQPKSSGALAFLATWQRGFSPRPLRSTITGPTYQFGPVSGPYGALADCVKPVSRSRTSINFPNVAAYGNGVWRRCRVPAAHLHDASQLDAHDGPACRTRSPCVRRNVAVSAMPLGGGTLAAHRVDHHPGPTKRPPATRRSSYTTRPRDRLERYRVPLGPAQVTSVYASVRRKAVVVTPASGSATRSRASRPPTGAARRSTCTRSATPCRLPYGRADSRRDRNLAYRLRETGGFRHATDSPSGQATHTFSLAVAVRHRRCSISTEPCRISHSDCD